MDLYSFGYILPFVFLGLGVFTIIVIALDRMVSAALAVRPAIRVRRSQAVIAQRVRDSIR